MIRYVTHVEQGTLYDSYKAHMNKENLELEYTINKNEIKVSTSNTSFVNLTRKDYIHRAEFEELIKEVRREARGIGAKLKGINKLSEFINENYHKYFVRFNDYDETFDVLVLLWEQNVHNIKVGYSDNAIYNKVLKKYEFGIQRYFDQDSILNQYHSYFYKLQNILEQLKAGEKYKSVAIA